MKPQELPEDVRRFILTSVPSVPYIESVLLLRREPAASWTSARLARRIYVSDAQASQLLQALQAAAIAAQGPGPETDEYRYAPSPELAALLDRVATHYAANLLAITDLIHSGLNRRATQFADAFRWRKDS
jgi:hypothetical protein